ncbi:putative ribonuclease H-like domain-containing protein, partial [Tanacetum coccineum]
ADFNNMDNTIAVSPIPTLIIHKDHPKGQILGDPTSAVPNKKRKIQKKLLHTKSLGEVTFTDRTEKTNHKDHQNCLVKHARGMLQFKATEVRYLLIFIWEKGNAKQSVVFGNKRDERSIVVKNKARLVAQGFRQEKESVFHQPPGFVDLAHPNKVYKVIKALYGLHQAPRAWCETLSSFLMENGFRRGTIDKTLFIKKKKSDIMLVQVYVDDIIFSSTKQSMCTEFEDCIHKRFQMSSMGELTFFLGLQVKQLPEESLLEQIIKDEDGIDVDVHVYRFMIGSLMYLTTSRPDIMFAVCACARFQVTPKASHLNAVKRILRYLKHQPKLGLWYPRDSPFKLEAFSDSDYGGASLDKKSTTCGCQFLGRRLISWQCKKQTIMENSTTEAEYVAAANCCGQVLWTQNQMMDYGFNFMNTRIHIDNESTISVIKNPVAHSRTKHIKIRFHFIRDCYEKRLIEVIKIRTDSNVADIFTKGFNVTRFNFFVPLEKIHLSEDQSEPQPDQFLRYYSSNPIPDSIPEGFGGNHGAQAANIKDLKARIKQLKKKA